MSAEDLAFLQGGIKARLDTAVSTGFYTAGKDGGLTPTARAGKAYRSDVTELMALKARVDALLAKQQPSAAANGDTANPTTVQGGFTLTGDLLKPVAGSTSTGRDMTDERTAQMAAQYAASQEAALRATLDLTTSVQARADLEKQMIDLQQQQDDARIAAQKAALDDDKSIGTGKRKELKGQLDAVEAQNHQVNALQKQAIDQQTAAELAAQALQLKQAGLDAQAEMASIELSMATTAKQRRELELKLLDLADARVRAEAEAVLASQISTDAEKQLAQKRLDTLAATRPGREVGVRAETRGPLEDWIANLPDEADKLNERLQSLAVNGIEGLNDAIVDLTTNGGKASDVLRNFARQLLADLERLSLQRLEANWFGGQSGGGAGPLGSLLFAGVKAFGGFNIAPGSYSLPTPDAGLDAAFQAGFSSIPGFASGTDFAPGGRALVGEHGPEVVNLPRGAQVIPNNMLGSLARLSAFLARPGPTAAPARPVVSIHNHGAPARAEVSTKADGSLAVHLYERAIRPGIKAAGRDGTLASAARTTPRPPKRY